MSNPPAPTPPQTRQKTSTTITKKPQKDPTNTEDATTGIHTKQQAINFLTSKEYLIPGNPLSLHTLAQILSQIGSTANKMPKALTDSIFAVAILMTDLATQHMANEIVSMIKTQLQEHLDTFASNVDTMRDAVEHVTGAAKEITGKLNDFNDGFQESADHLAQATQELAEKTTENTKSTATGLGLTHHLKTYASAIQQQQIPPTHESVIARGEQSAKQIMIRKNPDTTDNVLGSLTEKELVTKANTTLDLMGAEACDMPPGTAFVGARKLRNGDILYQLNTNDAKTWLTQTDTQKAFIANYGGTSNIQSKLYYVIAEFVPTTFIEDSTFTHLKIEEHSNICVDTIASSKYIKPAHLRNKNQKVAHVIFGFNDRNAANAAIQTGLFIEGKHTNVRKKLIEPRRCLKCQKFGHFVPDCKANVDTCARCNSGHRTSACDITDTSHFCCTNCTGSNAKGHGAADRNCPAFKTEQEKLHNRIPDNKYKFFPTSAPRTWKLLNEPDFPTEPQQQQRQQPTYARQHSNNSTNQQNPSDTWQTVQRGRPFTPLTHEDRHYVPQPRTYTRTTDSGWPSKPAQTTLDGYISNTQANSQPRRAASNAPPNQTTAQVRAQPPNPANAASSRESSTALEYV